MYKEKNKDQGKTKYVPNLVAPTKQVTLLAVAMENTKVDCQ